MKTEISVIIPAVSPLDTCTVIQSFLESSVHDQLFVQFVYLHNPQKVVHGDRSTQTQFETHEILYVASDRYFGSCEENIFRVQDFIELLKPFNVVVGEHDIVDWELLVKALEHRATHDLDAMSWNILSKQLKADGSYSTLPHFGAVDDTGAANKLVRMLLGGQTLDSSIAYPALLSLYGTMYWTAYVGNHLFSRDCLARLLQYPFTEHLCVQVYKQAQFFSEHNVRYGYFDSPVIQRVGDEFIKQQQPDHSWGWIENHRTVFGNSPSFQIAHVMHLYQIEGDALFNVIATCLGLSVVPAADGEQSHGRFAMLLEMLSWSADVVRHKLSSRSHYFPELAGKGTLQDLRYVKLLFTRLLTHMARYPEIYQPLEKDFKPPMVEAMNYLTNYLHSLNAGEELLVMTFERLAAARSSLNSELLVAVNQAAFNDYLSRQTRLAGA